MASIFTYEPDPPRVASPWLQSADENDGVRNTTRNPSPLADGHAHEPPTANQDRTVTRLQAEPQEGPVEYKLHLLLRPRRKFRSTSTGSQISGSRHSNFGVGPAAAYRTAPEPSTKAGPESGSGSSTQQTRQHRLQQLTTQLLWRLQQSSPHHSSSATNTILPSLPEALPELQAPHQPAKLLHGLEESQGALYEIGVSDDGTLVGLAEDEMHESLNNLRAMAACLGCTVEILRKETVGECEWIEEANVSGKERRRTGKLVVAEAFVKPCFEPKSPILEAKKTIKNVNDNGLAMGPETTPSGTEQLRITLTGPTMSGKSTLLGTLTTSTLDNGRGKSRLSMLKHRHEINSGVTSSVTQEIMGYQDAEGGGVDVVNYATENVASWIDVHVAANDSRIVLISDSAGHPRYRRTTVRGLVGWAPHWTLLCVPADDSEDSASKNGSTSGSLQGLGGGVSEMDLSGAQMDLCLRLGLPLVIVITKLDLASRTGLKETLSKVLDALKAAGRKPAIIPNVPGTVTEKTLQSINAALIENAYKASLPLLNDPIGTVPIVLTSAVQGTGISNLQALLHELPLPNQPQEVERSMDAIFHIEDVYNKPAEKAAIVVSGRLRSGRVSVGTTMMLGPFATHESMEDSEDSDERPHRRGSSHLPASRSFPGALPHLAPPLFNLPREWRRVEVISIRNLRLPQHSMSADQVGTIALVPDSSEKDVLGGPAPLTRIRKGMVLAIVQPQATRTLVAEFKREDIESLAAGNHVVIYSASVRASARIVSARAPDSPVQEKKNDSKRDSREFAAFDLDSMNSTLNTEKFDTRLSSVDSANLLVTLSFDSSKEFVVPGDQVLVMPGGGPGLYGGNERGEKGIAGLEGFVGRIIDIHG